MASEQSLLIVLTAGPADGGRKAAIAFGVALAALSHGTSVNMFLSLESAVFGTPSGADGVHPRGFSEPLTEYIQHFVDLGGSLEVCSSCFEEYCRHMPNDEAGRPALRPGTEVRSLGVVAERSSQMPVLTF